MGNKIGITQMPSDFRYRDVIAKGKPEHGRFDDFCIRHPKMATGRRAKIFSPFDALKGFNEAVASKSVIYTERKILSEEEQEKIDRELQELKELTYNSRVAKENNVQIEVTYFSLCLDANNDAYGRLGLYEELGGVCQRVDDIYKILYVDDAAIAFEDIFALRISKPL